MPLTPLRWLGPQVFSDTIWDLDLVAPTDPGKVAYVDQGGGVNSWRMVDSLGAFNPRDGGVPVPNAIGQVLFAITDNELSVQQPMTSSGGWLVNSDGTLLVAG